MEQEIEQHLHDYEDVIGQSWAETSANEVIKRLAKGEELPKILDSLPGFAESFDQELDTIDCSDGRVLDGRKIGIAGSGLLLSPEERAKFIALYKGKTKKVTAHADCGAAAKKFAELQSVSPEQIPAGVTTADDYGVVCAQKLAEELGAEYEFLEREGMASPNHNERALVLDQTGRFDSGSLEGFPPHFVCTGAGLGFSEEYMKEELETLTGIALGDHGFGQRLSEDKPFYIMVAANDYNNLAHWEKIAKEATQKFGARVVVDGFVKPGDPENN